MKHIFSWAVTLCRIVIGLVVIQAGFDFARGSGPFAYREADALTGVFVMILGAYIIISSLTRHFFDRSE